MRSFSAFWLYLRELGTNRSAFRLAGAANGSRAEDDNTDAEPSPDADIVVGAGAITPVSTAAKGRAAAGTTGSAAAAAATLTPTHPPPLTHEQLPDESIYILDGTSMLFRAFYGRGAGG